MNTIICKRCGKEAAKATSRKSKVWGGRICKDCAEECGRLIRSAVNRWARSTRVAHPVPEFTPEKKVGLINKLTRLFRRRGVQ